MLNNFSVQASVNEFYNAQRVYKEAASQALPQVNKQQAVLLLLACMQTSHLVAPCDKP
jgi:hypothetical protein